MRFNNYDITKPCIGQLCYDFDHITKFMNQDSIKEALGVPKDIDYEICNSEVGNHMRKFDWRMNAAPKLVDLLNNDVKVMLYHGDLDMICNWVGGQMAIDGVEWYGQNEFKKETFQNIGFGLERKFRSLKFIKFSNAGHMVPMDQPKSALKMMMDFINTEDL